MVLREREFTAVDHKPATFVTEWIVGIVGALTTAIGLFMYHGPAEGVLSIFGWEWNIAELNEAWPFSVIVVGAMIMAGVFARLSQRLSMDGPTTKANVSTGLTVASLLLALTYALIWIF